MNPNVDPAERRKFSDLAHRWWDPSGTMGPLHEMNPLRLDWIDSLAELADKDVLDVGCGGGILVEAMAKRGARVTGIDLADKSLQIAELHALESGVEARYRKIAAEDLALESPGRFDIVTCMELLEHVPDPARTVQACADLVRPGGTVFFSTINRNAKAFLFAIVGAEHVLRLLPRGTHEYDKFVRPSELATHVRSAGLAIIELRGMTFNPLSRRFALSADADVNYLVACRKP
jgi:2-polyprenyl-6-hydroxyphenyl methylase/3-demethylubiquinone-9 3-methyltransferase